MEEAPGDSDALQPQDLSSCGLPSIFERDEALLKDGLRVVQTPGWFLNPGTSDGLLLPEPGSDPLPDQIQSDDAFSNTTVTLSYVSRSHVFSDHSPVYGVPSAFLRAYDAGKLDAGDAALPLDQHCLQPVSVPVGMAACEPFGFMSPVVENMAAFCYLQPPPSLQDVENLALETLKSLQADPAECHFPISLDELQNGVWNIEGGFPEDAGMNAEGLHQNLNPELVFLISRSGEPLALANGQGSAGLAISLNQDMMTPLDPASPPAEQTEDVFALPQTTSPPSGAEDHGNQQEEADVPEPELSCPKQTDPEPELSCDKVKEPEPELSGHKPTETEPELSCDKVTEPELSWDKPTEEATQENGESTGADAVGTKHRSFPTRKTVERKTLPPRSRRGMRMEAIVQEIHPVRSRFSRRTRRAASRLRIDRTAELLQREPMECRRSCRRRATPSTSASTNTDSFPTRTRKTYCIQTRNFHPAFRNPAPKAPVKRSPSGKRKRKKHKPGRTSFFPPQEPEIKLKCLDHREERREARDESFAPYVRLHLREFPACTVVNYPGKRPAAGRCGPGAIPATPGLQFGRVCLDGAQREFLVCCLCGASSNSTDLGDLHGPYYPDGLRSAPAPPEEVISDSDSSCRGRRSGTFRQRFELKSDEDVSGAPDESVDWFSPPVVPLGRGERWLHEDCAVWSAGVFLVRGKLYGLENAIRMADASVCSRCQRRGATLGCVCKGCPSRFHYTCALQSGCVLNEDNFSMKCRKHKKQTLSGSSQLQTSR